MDSFNKMYFSKKVGFVYRASLHFVSVKEQARIDIGYHLTK